MLKKLLIILFLTTVCLGANEVQIGYPRSNTLYFRIFDATGQVWNTDSVTFESWTNGNVTDYDITLTGTGGSFYQGTFPTISDGTYSVIAYLQDTGTPGLDDRVISSGFMEWRSNTEIDWSALIDLIDDIIEALIDLAMPRTQAGRTLR